MQHLTQNWWLNKYMILNMDRLLDTKYTKEQLTAMINEFKIGQEVKLTEQCLLWIKENTYYFHTVGAVRENGVIPKEYAESSFFIDLYISNNLPYKAEIVGFLSDVGTKAPGARIKITLPNNQSTTMIQSVLDFY